MSKFKDGVVFIFVNDVEATVQMINVSTSATKGEMPSKQAGLVLYRMIETQEPVHSVFDGYVWYGKSNVLAAWEAL